MMRFFSCLAMLLACMTGFSAQKPSLVVHKSFDNELICYDSIDVASRTEIQRMAFVPTYSQGISGKALDLTADVAERIPVWLTAEETPDYEKNFSFIVWVQTLPDALQGTAIMGNKRNYNPHMPVHRERTNIGDNDHATDESKAPGWLLGTTEEGAWYFYASDGNQSYVYEPTARRQRINDGKWHMIAATVDLEEKEMRLYFDGRNVAIYNIEDIESVASTFSTVIGGTDDFAEKDHGRSRGEWSSFNGKVDEVRFWKGILPAKAIQDEFLGYFPDDKECLLEVACPPDRLKVQVWNIWHGGRRFGQQVGLQRIIEVLQGEQADIIGMIETYGSGAAIADSLGYYYYLISDNLSIYSRYPIEKTIRLYKSFRSGGAEINVGSGRKIAFFDIWLDWRIDEYRSADMEQIQGVLSQYAERADKMPVISVGDYNSGSHLDEWKKINWKEGVLWPSKVMADLGFKDSFREMNRDSNRFPGYTWTPMRNKGVEKVGGLDRVDYIYYKGKDLKLYRSESFDHHPVFWPSDHASVVSWFYLK